MTNLATEEQLLIPLSKGKVAIVDDDDYAWLMQWKWHYSCGYAIRKDGPNKTPRKTFHMHREINKTPLGMQTDHINGNKLDNRKCNLRTATSSQNKWNIGPNQKNTSGHVGVHWNVRDKRWVASIRHNGRRFNLGNFVNKEDAIEARVKAETKYRGEFRRAK